LVNEKFETIAGLVTFEFGHLPERGEEISIDPFHFKITSANSRRVNSIQVTLSAEDESGVSVEFADNVNTLVSDGRDSDDRQSIEKNG
jgi:Mg2+/Co2+ transporter CorC